MKRKAALILIGAAAAALLLGGCGKNEASEAANESLDTEENGQLPGEGQEDPEKDTEKEEKDQEKTGSEEEVPIKTVAVFFPDDTDTWMADGDVMTAKLTEEGYSPCILFADGDAQQQIEQIESMIQQEAAALIIDPVDTYGLAEVLDTAQDAGIPVFSYERLIMKTPAVNYFTTFDMRKTGRAAAERIVEMKDLPKMREKQESCTIEFLMGSPDDTDALFFYNGLMEVLGEYLEDGTLVCNSQKSSFADTAVMDADAETAVAAIKGICFKYYMSKETPDIICTASDAYVDGVVEFIKNKKSPQDEDWPIITGMGSEAQAVRDIAEGEAAFTLYFDREELAAACVTMVDSYLSGETPEVTDYAQYDNGIKIIGTVTCEPELIDADNYQILIDNGTYMEEEIAPEPSPTPEPSSTPEPSPIPTVSPLPGLEDQEKAPSEGPDIPLISDGFKL